MALTAADVLKTFKQNGLRLTIISVASTICLGVADQFTSRIIPSITTRIEHFFDPPRFFITFDAPVDISADVTVTTLGEEGAPSFPIKRTEERILTVHAGPGVYVLRLRRRQNNEMQELVAPKEIEKTKQFWNVDTNDRNWANAAKLRGGTASAASPAAQPWTATRWSLTEPDFAVVASVQDPALRSMLANALAEVGTFEQGTDREKRRILSYWTGITNVTSVTIPWNATFVGWVVRQAGAEPPRRAAIAESWRLWGEEVSPASMTPGVVAVFVPKAASGAGGLAGIMLRRQPDCIEVVAGNVVNRVVITCVKTSLLVSARRPVMPAPETAPADSEEKTKGE